MLTGLRLLRLQELQLGVGVCLEVLDTGNRLIGDSEMGQSEEREKLLGLPLLQNMPDDAKKRIGILFLRVSKMVTLSDGDRLLHEGYLGGDAGFVLLSGIVEVRKEGADPVAVSAPTLLGEMRQFNPQAQRTATVRAKGHVNILKFSWQELYAQARKDLPETEQTMLMENIERIVWERFDRETLIDLALLRGLSDQLKLRACLLLQWIAQPVSLTDGETLFEQDGLCGATGFLLTRGEIEIKGADRPLQAICAPNILGVMPQFDPDLRWTAKAIAKGDVEVLRFSWSAYTAMLQQRLSQEDQRLFNDTIRANTHGHFVH